MQIRWRSALAAFAGLAALGGGAAGVRADFDALSQLLGGHYARIGQLTTPADKTAFRGFFQRISLPQYRFRTPQGQMLTRAQSLARLEKPGLRQYGLPETATVTEQRMTIDSLTMHSQTARVVVVHTTKLRFNDASGRFGEKDAEKEVTLTARLWDNWVRTPNGWRLLSTEPLTEEATVDGKPLPRTTGV